MLLFGLAVTFGWSAEGPAPGRHPAGEVDRELNELSNWIAASPDPVRIKPGDLLRQRAAASDRLLRPAKGDDTGRLGKEVEATGKALSSALAWEPRGGIGPLLARAGRLLVDPVATPRTCQRFLDSLEGSLDLEAALGRRDSPFHDFLFGLGAAARSRYAMALHEESSLYPSLDGWAPQGEEPMSGRNAYDVVMDRARNAPLSSLLLTRAGEQLSFAFIRSMLKEPGSRTRVLPQERTRQRSPIDASFIRNYIHEPIRLRMDLSSREGEGTAELWTYCKDFRAAHRFDVTLNGVLRVPFRIHPRLHSPGRKSFWLAFSFPAEIVRGAPEVALEAVLHLLPGEELRQENFQLKSASISRPAFLLRVK